MSWSTDNFIKQLCIWLPFHGELELIKYGLKYFVIKCVDI